MRRKAQKQNKVRYVTECFGNTGEGLGAQQSWGWISRKAAWGRLHPRRVLKECSAWYTVESQIPTNE